MSILRFSDGANVVELAPAIEEDAPQAAGDAYVTIRVQSAGFVGHNDLWLCAGDVRAFCGALAALDKTLRGKKIGDRPRLRKRDRPRSDCAMPSKKRGLSPIYA